MNLLEIHFRRGKKKEKKVFFFLSPYDILISVVIINKQSQVK